MGRRFGVAPLLGRYMKYHQTTRREVYVRAFQRLLASRGPLLTVEAAAYLNVTQRTIHRYTKILRSQGFRVIGSAGRGGGIKLL